MKIAVAGYGIEGQESVRYFSNMGDITVVDESQDTTIPEGCKAILGEFVYDDMSQFDMVVRTAGLPPRKLKHARKIWSATNEFFKECPAPIIGITGTKGKGTTSSFIASILKSAGKTVHLVGNIGVPALSVLKNINPSDVVVYEMSSFQLWDLERSPNVAVVLMIEPDHLDVHSDFDEYIAAKSNIRRHQGLGDKCIFHPTNEFSSRIANVSTNGAESPIKYADRAADQVYVHDGHFYRGDAVICSTDYVKIPGDHNLDNACAAISAALAYMPEISAQQIAKGLEAFEGLPHRLKYVAEKSGVRFYDDSISTTPGSAIAAIKAFRQPKVMIMGGSYKGADFRPLVQIIANSNVHGVVLIGDEASRINQALVDVGWTGSVVDIGTTGMKDAVESAYALANSGDVVILSPSCASFGMFKNYKDRGEQFIEAVGSLNER